MKQDHLFKQIEIFVREEKIMEAHYKIDNISTNEPIFTDRQEMAVRELINDRLTTEEILNAIRRW